MIIRATSKLLNISGIKPVKFSAPSTDVFPGDWYAKTVKTGHLGKIVILFFHNNLKISIICPTKSLNIAIKQFPDRLKNFLTRHDFEFLMDKFDLHSEIQIYTTDSKSTLAHMNQISFNIEWHLSNAVTMDNFNYDYLEDIQTEYLLPSNNKTKKYETTLDILKEIKESEI
jgi:hypothetical protein